MKTKLMVAALSVLVASGAAQAGGCDDDFDKGQVRDKIQLQLATILASEAACGLTYDQDAISAFITKQHIDEKDAIFVSDLSLITGGMKPEIEGMSKGVLAAPAPKSAAWRNRTDLRSKDLQEGRERGTCD
jgi:hypothetical protein